MKEVKIYFNDLTEEKQKELLDTAGITDPKEANWDMNILPVAIVDLEED